MFTMGDDFTYQNARQNFKNMDKLIKYMNSRTEETGIHVMYSTPACYLEVCEYLMKKDKIWIFRQLNRIQLCTQRNQMTSSHMVVEAIVIGQVTLPQDQLSSSRQSDFFGVLLSFEIGLTKLIIFRWNWPNFLTLASGEAWCKRFNRNKTNWHFKEDYWPVMIGSIKKLKSTLKPQWFNLIPALSIIPYSDESNVKCEFDLHRAMGLMQHHDAVTGTEKQNVAEDYTLRLTRATDTCQQENINTLINRWTGFKSHQSEIKYSFVGATWTLEHLT